MAKHQGNQENQRFLLATGGTGGHVFPALTLAQHLKEKGAAVHLTTDTRGERFFHDAPGDLAYTILQDKNLGDMSLFRRLLASIPVCRKAIRIVKAFAPDKIIAFGGYPCFPICVAAVILRVPLFMHEQNAVLGKVSKLFLPYCKKLFLSFPGTLGIKKKYKHKVLATGNIVRPIFLKNQQPYPAIEPKSLINILVLGGSQGASGVTSLALEAVGILPIHLKLSLNLTVQAPEKSMKHLEDLWPDIPVDDALHKVKGTMKPFFDDMPDQLARAHLVISRAGASTVWELIAAKRPSILIPLPSAADNHQLYNAKYLVDKHCAWRLHAHEMSPFSLRGLISTILGNSELLPGHYANLCTLHDSVFEKNPLEIITEILHSGNLS